MKNILSKILLVTNLHVILPTLLFVYDTFNTFKSVIMPVPKYKQLSKSINGDLVWHKQRTWQCYKNGF